MRIVAGVDGCPGGWVAAVWSSAGIEWRVTPLSIAGLLETLADAERIAIDVPIGYGPDRECDRLAKKLLGKAHVRVFLTPSRGALTASSHAEACRVSREECGKGISIQAWHIGARVVDATEHADARLVEAHPEVSFAALAGEVLPRKKTRDGVDVRRAVLAPVFGDVRPAPRPARTDDALDALACAWTARRVLDGEAEYLGEGPRIWY